MPGLAKLWQCAPHSADMSSKTRYFIAIGLLVLTLGLLWPGLTREALTIRAVLDVDGVGGLVDKVAASQIPPERLAQIRPMLNPARLGSFDDGELSDFIGRLLGGVVRGKIEGARAELHGAQVYEQKQTILVTIRFLFENHSYLAGTLILCFSVVVPFGKALLFLVALHVPVGWRERLLGFINAIGKWSMADVFVVSIYTAYLAARNSEGVGQPIHFQTEYGPGFYYFAAYCVVSLAAQQAAVAMLRVAR